MKLELGVVTLTTSASAVLQAPGAVKGVSRQKMGAIPAQWGHGAARWEQSHQPHAPLVQLAAGVISLLWLRCLNARDVQLAPGVACRAQLRRMSAKNVKLVSGTRKQVLSQERLAMTAQLVGLARLWAHLSQPAAFLVEKVHGAFRMVPRAAGHVKLARRGDGVRQRAPFSLALVWPARLGDGAARQELRTSARARHVLQVSSVPWTLQHQRALASPVKLEDTSQLRLLAIRCCAFRARLEILVT